MMSVQGSGEQLEFYFLHSKSTPCDFVLVTLSLAWLAVSYLSYLSKRQLSRRGRGRRRARGPPAAAHFPNVELDLLEAINADENTFITV